MSQDTSRQCLRMDTGAVQRPSERRRDLEAWADACVRWGRRARTEGGLTPRWDLNLWLALSRALALSLSFPFLLSPARAWARPPPVSFSQLCLFFLANPSLSLFLSLISCFCVSFCLPLLFYLYIFLFPLFSFILFPFFLPCFSLFILLWLIVTGGAPVTASGIHSCWMRACVLALALEGCSAFLSGTGRVGRRTGRKLGWLAGSQVGMQVGRQVFSHSVSQSVPRTNARTPSSHEHSLTHVPYLEWNEENKIVFTISNK